MPRIQQLLQSLIPNQPILHISFFDGIGAASQALKFLGAQVIFTMSWETNTDCQAILHQHHQPIQHGDITTLDRDTINLLIQPIVQDNPDIIILITTGPPCVDFSRLRHQPPGTDGDQGSLLQRQVEIILDLQTDWPDYLILYLLENVVPHPDVEAQFQAITEQLQCRPYLVDAKDGGLISRPRMWWQNIRWEAAAHIVHQYTPCKDSRTTFGTSTTQLQPFYSHHSIPRTGRHQQSSKTDNHSTAWRHRPPPTTADHLPRPPM